MNRKRQILDHLLNDLEETYWEFLEAALEYSDMKEAKKVITYIMQK